MQGIFPKMNEIYVFVNEMSNFTKDLRSTLGVAPASSVHVCLAAARALVADGMSHFPDLAAPRPTAGEDGGEGGGVRAGGAGERKTAVGGVEEEELVNYVVTKGPRS
jgi:hypothetical protein